MPVQAIPREMTEVSAKRTVVMSAMILGMAWGSLMTVGAFIVWTVDMKMPCSVALKTKSLCRREGLWAQTGVLRCNTSGVRGGLSLLKSRMNISEDISGDINQSGGSGLQRGSGTVQTQSERRRVRCRNR